MHPKPAVVPHAWSPNTQEAEAGDICELEGSLVYIEFQTSQEDLISKKQQHKLQPKKKINTFIEKHNQSRQHINYIIQK